MAANENVNVDTAAPQDTNQKKTSEPVTGFATTEMDDFGLPVRRFPTPEQHTSNADCGEESPAPKETATGNARGPEPLEEKGEVSTETHNVSKPPDNDSDDDKEQFQDAQSEPATQQSGHRNKAASSPPDPKAEQAPSQTVGITASGSATQAAPTEPVPTNIPQQTPEREPLKKPPVDTETAKAEDIEAAPESPKSKRTSLITSNTTKATNEPGVSEFSHQQLSTQQETKGEDEDIGWQKMPAYARYDMYDDNDRIIAREYNDEDEDKVGYAGLGGAGKGYTRVLMDEDAESATSMDENTQYLFKESYTTSAANVEDDDARDAMSQMQATKDLLTEGQRIAYVGVVRLEIDKLARESGSLESSRKTKKEIAAAAESLRMWGQKMMIRLYSHMDITEAEQVMIEQLAQHGVQPRDLTPALLANARVQNPMAKEAEAETEAEAEDKALEHPEKADSPPLDPDEELPAEAPPPYSVTQENEDVPEVQTPSQLPQTQKIDIDLRWTVLCDLFLVLIADSTYDARSRVLLEKVGASLDVPWLDICRFEKRVIDALEMQQAAEKENWNEEQHMENRRKAAKTRRYVMMGLATVGGGLVIGLSAGLLAPVIGAGLAAGFTTIGVTGTSGFLAGAGGAAVITSSAAASGSFIGIRAANRRTGAVRTFEYRPLHNNKKVNLIVTVSGWLTGKVDDVRLPFSTVDPTMGDIYSVLWEPEMLRSTGDTINILATEALSQGLQQLLGSTILVGLMAALQLPIVLTKLSYLIDNPWAVSLDRAVLAGQILADSIVERNLGTRPITLVGYSLGSRVIFSCLQELGKKGAHGLIQNVYMFGSPVVVKKEEYMRARTVVAGRFVNGYNKNDWILGYLFRLTNGGIRRVAGLAEVADCPWVENVDTSELVKGHMDYRAAMPALLMKCGWMVESGEFTEIEDPDPDDHQGRQRELINEIEEARKELEREGKAGKGGKFGIFGRRKKTERQEWELYEEEKGKAPEMQQQSSNHGVLFDVDAIRAELAREAHEGNMEELQIREIQSTLPPMKLDLSSSSPTSPSPSTPVGSTLGTSLAGRSAETLPVRGSTEGRLAASDRQTRQGSGSSMSPEEDDIQMTFDTDFNDTSVRTPSNSDGVNRPGIRASQTVPDIKLSNPWGDPDDEDFGKEKEITMTFA